MGHLDVDSLGHKDAPRRTVSEIAVGRFQLWILHRERGLGLWAVHPLILDIVHTGHPLPVLIVLADHHQHIPGLFRRGVLPVGEPGDDQGLHRRILNRHRVGHLGSQAVAHHARPFGVDVGQGLEILERGPAPVGLVEIRVTQIVGNARVAPPDGVDAKHDEPPACHLQAIGIAGLPIVLIPVDIDGAR